MSKKPNIVVIYADDLGFGDVGCYGAKTIPTPNLDKLAANGLKFNHGYAAAATCTPARYSMLTGVYPYRHPRAHILAGDAPSLFADGESTIADKLKGAGYRTGIVGKWHLGLGNGNIDWNGDIEQTPNDVGFESSYIMAATNDRVPCVYVDNRRVENLDPNDPISVSYNENDIDKFTDYPTGRNNPDQLTMSYHHGHDMTIINGVSRIGLMNGGKSALWTDETMCDVFIDKAKGFITEHKDEPFFLFYALHQPHVPRLPAPRFVGSTPHGPRGDVIVELDWCVGEVISELEKQGILDDTLIVFSSDNGPVLQDGYHDDAVEKAGDHKQAGPLRGGKYSLFDGGTRVPFIVSWPSTITPGESDALVCQTDLYASFATLAGLTIADDEAGDSINVAEALTGKSQTGRAEVILEGIGHKTLFRQGDWVFIPPYQGEAVAATTGIELGNSEEKQLYHLGQDMGQVKNLAADEPAKLAELETRLNSLMALDVTREASVATTP